MQQQQSTKMPLNRIAGTAFALIGLGEAYTIYNHISEGAKHQQRLAEIQYYRRMNRMTAAWMHSDAQQSEADRLRYGRIKKPQELLDYERSIGRREIDKPPQASQALLADL